MIRLEITQKNLLRLLVLGLVLALFYLPGMREGFFPVDDEALLSAPQLRCTWPGVQSIFQLGTNLDYYPVRDLSYAIDWCLWGDTSNDAFGPRLQNWIWFFGIVILFYFLLIEAQASEEWAFWGTSILLVHPLHSEMLMWPSARKDLVAIFFCLASFLLALRRYKKNEKLDIASAIAIISLFLLGMFAKASIALAPFGVLLWLLVNRKDSDRRYAFVAVACCVLSILSILIQKYQYGSVNDMEMDYTVFYRSSALLATLGRYVVGLFWYGSNTVDVANWYPWAQLNYAYIVVGLIAGLLLLSASVILIIRKSPFFWCLFVPFLVYLINPGPNVFHRNFYSVRYLELSLFVFVFLLILAISQKKIKNRRFVCYALLLFFLAQSYREAGCWESVQAVAKKSYEFQTKNPANQYLYLISLMEQSRWGKGNAETQNEMEALIGSLNEDCTCNENNISFPNGSLCAKFWADASQIAVRVSRAISAEDLSCYRKQLAQSHTVVAQESAAGISLYQNPNLAKMEEFGLEDILPTPRLRFYRVAKACLDRKPADASALKDRYMKKSLWDRKIVAEELALLPKEEKSQIQRCL